MRKITLLLLFPLLAFWAGAQTPHPEYVLSRQMDIRAGHILHQNGKTFLGGAQGAYCDYGVAWMIDSTGMKDTMFYLSGNFLDDFKIRTTDSIVIGSTSWQDNGDVEPLDQGVFFFGLSQDGEVLFSDKLLELGMDTVLNDGHSVFVSHDPTGKLILATYDKLIFLDSLNEFESIRYMGNSVPFQGITQWADSLLIAHVGYESYLMDFTGTILDTLVGASPIKEVLMDGDRVLFLENGGIMAFHPLTGGIQYHDAHSSEIGEPMDMAANASSLFILDGQENEKIIQLDKNTFGITDSIRFQRPDCGLKGIAATEGELLLLGEEGIYSENSWEGMWSPPFVKTIPILETPIFHESDLSINIWMDTMDLTLYNIFGNDTLYNVAGNVGYNFEVTNTGPDTIWAFTVTSMVTGGVQCAYGRHFSYHDNTPLAPGESFIENGSYGIPVVEIPHTFRMYTFAPNHYLEPFMGDNSDWAEAPYRITTSTEDLGAEQSTLRVFPNPAATMVRVELPDVSLENETLTLCDVAGRPVLRIPHKNRPYLDVDVSHLPKGIYFLSCGRLSAKIALAR